jgi:hypothetical protein
MKMKIKEMLGAGFSPLVALNLLLGVSLAASKELTFTTIDFPGATDTSAFEINSVGEIVGGYGDANDVGQHLKRVKLPFAPEWSLQFGP